MNAYVHVCLRAWVLLHEKTSYYPFKVKFFLSFTHLHQQRVYKGFETCPLMMLLTENAILNLWYP